MTLSDTLARIKYAEIIAWHEGTGSCPSYVVHQVHLANDSNAPQGTIYLTDGVAGGHVDEIACPDLRETVRSRAQAGRANLALSLIQ